MDHSKLSTTLFDVFLRLRPGQLERERFIDVDDKHLDSPTHITVTPPKDDTRRRAVERYAFTRVFAEDAGQREIFENTGAVQLIQGVLGDATQPGRDGLLATLGVTGSGKSHTILGSKSQRGLTQLTLDLLFRHTEQYLANAEASDAVFSSIYDSDMSEAQMLTASVFLDHVYGNGDTTRLSRATTPAFESSLLFIPSSTKRHMPRVSALPTSPAIDDISIEIDEYSEYAIVISMYEVYNDRIFDLLTASAASGKSLQKRRALLYKNTEQSPDRKVVSGLKKVICSNLEDALMVLETGLTERRVAGTGSNATSSRSHGFFCIDVKRRLRGKGIPGPWTSNNMAIVDLAGSERAREAKTAGAQLAEGGQINQSLMYLGQCMELLSKNSRLVKPHQAPYRQCKLTDILFGNSLAAPSQRHNPPQKSIMIVAADPHGDYNATNQILHYSTLAKEVAIPRIPSLSSTIFSGMNLRSGRPTTPNITMEQLEMALAEADRLNEELAKVSFYLEEETQRRMNAEASWAAAVCRMDEVEQEIRDEVWSEMEAQMVQEQRRWRIAQDEEQDRRDAHLDRKLEIMARGIEVYEDDDENKENINEVRGGMGKTRVMSSRVEELQDENDILRQKLASMERERGLKSPSKKTRVLKSRKWDGSGMGLDNLL